MMPSQGIEYGLICPIPCSHKLPCYIPHDKSVSFHRFVPEGEAIDLINVAFEQKSQLNNSQKKKRRKEKMSEGGNATGTGKQTTMNFNVPDRLTGISGLEELQRLNPARRWNFIEVTYCLTNIPVIFI